MARDTRDTITFFTFIFCLRKRMYFALKHSFGQIYLPRNYFLSYVNLKDIYKTLKGIGKKSI